MLRSLFAYLFTDLSSVQAAEIIFGAVIKGTLQNNEKERL